MLTIQGTKESVHAVATVNLNAVYDNGDQPDPTLGWPSTLTATANGVLVVDGYAPAITNRVLVTAQTNPAHNGIYRVIDAGSSTTPWFLKRYSDANNSDEGLAAKMVTGLLAFVRYGTVNGTSTWLSTTTVDVVGTDPNVWVRAHTALYAFAPSAKVWVVKADTFGVGKGTVNAVAVASTTTAPTTISYAIIYDNTTRPTASVDSSLVFGDVDSALAFYKPLIT